MTTLTRPVSRETQKRFAHSSRPIVVTLAPGTLDRDDLIQTRLKGTQTRYVARIADVHRMLALWHANKIKQAKRTARLSGVPWRIARKSFIAENRID